MAEEKLKILYLMQIQLEETDVMIHPHKESLFYATVTVTVSPQFFGWLMHEPDMVDPVWGVDEDDV